MSIPNSLTIPAPHPSPCKRKFAKSLSLWVFSFFWWACWTPLYPWLLRRRGNVWGQIHLFSELMCRDTRAHVISQKTTPSVGRISTGSLGEFHWVNFTLFQENRLKMPDRHSEFMDDAAAAKSLQWCPTLRDPIDGSPPGSPVPRILQARTLEWVAISFSSAWKWKVKVKSLSHVRLFATPWTAAHQASLSMGFSRQDYWSGVPLPSPEFMDEEGGILSETGALCHKWTLGGILLRDCHLQFPTVFSLKCSPAFCPGIC